MLVDVENEAVRLLERHGFDPATPPRAELLAMCVLGSERIVTRRGLWVPARYSPALDVIEVRAGLTPSRREWCIAHELAERVLLRGCWSSDVVEQVADSLGGALLAPGLAVRRALRSAGRHLPALAEALRVSQSIASLRLGEVTGSPVALVTERRIHVRGEDFAWPHEAELRRVAASASAPEGVERRPLTDAPGRLVLLAG